MAAVVEKVGVNLPAGDLNGPQVANSVDLSTKYSQEREKRLRADGSAQFLDLSTASDRVKALFEDPWIEPGTPINDPIGGHSRVLIVGAGFGGLLFAVRLIKQGFKAEDIVLVDVAGGFGGTWYWNRYPGLMCDVESYIYLPLLEEMDYVPKQKYSSGNELREYAESIATKYKLHSRAMFQSRVRSFHWNADQKQWDVKIEQNPKDGKETSLQVTSDFVIMATGVLNNPKLPDLKGGNEFRGEMLHTSRWNYSITGGDTYDPQLTRLKDKRVAIIGTGATAIQAVPQLARWSKELTIFQRTPSSVDVRNNRDTDLSTYKSEIATGPGWQKKRNENFTRFINNYQPKPEVNMVDDGWTRMPSYSALIGGPNNVTMETIGEHVGRLHALDATRANRVRQRVTDTVKDNQTSKSLQAWYPGWCKRPCFHDFYLAAFNEPNVKLVDTDGKGVDRLTEKGIVVNGHEYEVDVLVWAVGYDSHVVGMGKGHIEVVGKDGARLDEQFQKGWSTLHGVVSRGFPNMFWPGPLQAGVSANFMYVLDMLATHISYIMSTACKRDPGGRAVIEPSVEAVEEWAVKIMSRALAMAAMAGCTPSYLNNEGESDRMTQAQQMKAARGGIWGSGILEYSELIENWRTDDKLQGLEVTV